MYNFTNVSLYPSFVLKIIVQIFFPVLFQSITINPTNTPASDWVKFKFGSFNYALPIPTNTTALPCINVFLDFSNADGSSASTLGLDSAQLMLHGLQCLHFMIWKTPSFRPSPCSLHLKIVGILLCAAIAGSCERPHPLTPFSILSFFHHPCIFPRVIYPYFLLFKNNQKHIQKASTFWQCSQVQQGIKQSPPTARAPGN